jgi:FkbM family methyltransferase
MEQNPIEIIHKTTKFLKTLISNTPIRRLPGIELIYSKISNTIEARRYQNIDVPEKVRYRGKLLYVFPESDWAKRIYVEGRYSVSDEDEWNILNEHLSKCDLAFDVGAFVGTHSIMMREIVGEKGQVYSFEPQPDCVDLLERTNYINGFDNCTIIPKSVGDRNGIQKLMTTATPDATSNVVGSDPWDQRYDEVDVDMIRLDSFLERNQINDVDFIKVDVQGAGLQVIKGIGERISDISAMHIEIHSKYIEDPSKEVTELFDILHSKGSIIRTDIDEPILVENPDELIFKEEHPSVLWESY